ncbi:MAG: hypothetical protein Q9178_008062 [Gyalolechia marmorata]
MNDPDVIAYLFPVDGNGGAKARVAIHMVENKDRFVPPRQPRTDLFAESDDSEDDRYTRETTEEEEEEDDGGGGTQEDGPCLALRFSQLPKTRRGLVAGRGPKSDIVLPKLKRVSASHFALTFDDENELVMRDLNSTMGTGVLYSNPDDAARRGFGIDFSARGPDLLGGKAPVIKILSNLMFKLVVPHHDTSSSTYLDNVARFRQGTPDISDDLFADLALRRSKTKLPTPSAEGLALDIQVPGAILWTKELARGKEYALKKPLPEKNYKKAAWLKEARLLEGLRHDNIVQLKHSAFDNEGPKLYFKYVPKGSLEKYQQSATSFHRQQAAVQVLSALEYLHELEPPLVHRDIKPENYLAPEGYTKQTNTKYGPLVDIWSVGVLLVWLEIGKLAKYVDYYKTDNMAWATALVEFVQAYLRRCRTNELISFILEDMLVPQPTGRRPARECRTRAELLEYHGPESFSEIGSESSDSSDKYNESNPATPRALPADSLNFAEDLGRGGDSEAPTIRPGFL